MPSTSSSSSNTSYNPLSPFGAVEIPHSDTPPDSHSSQRTTPLSREPSVDSTSTHLPQGNTSSVNSRARATEKACDMEDDQQGKEKGKDISRNTSPSGSSQGGLADNEMEAGPSTQTEEPATPVPPPKKKRTRTLTTPHQAAVLHALLAQVSTFLTPHCASIDSSRRSRWKSRFPTTAMREEVGRQIGLSARKVQVSKAIIRHRLLLILRHSRFGSRYVGLASTSVLCADVFRDRTNARKRVARVDRTSRRCHVRPSMGRFRTSHRALQRWRLGQAHA